ncbi:DUF2721 domain-containing protein, partial [Klebsiella pneumoniae]|uniref:DUF2721 domain-containing protein n=1 Tax=Klebsiella pneumoniae TaxID=573 RepID=UPI003853464E
MRQRPRARHRHPARRRPDHRCNAHRCNARMIAQTIQLSLAPVFVLVAIGNIMNILTTRLGRIVDRSRVLQKLHAQTDGAT